MREERQVAVFVVIVMFLWALAAYFGQAQGASLFPTQYDEQIQSATKQYWVDYPDWRTGKSQLFQESRLDPNARSPVGAEGMGQFMGPTWLDMERAIFAGATISRSLAGPSIQAYAYYMARLRRSWSGTRPLDDRQRLGESSYNAGTGNILKAQKFCGGAMLWANIAPCLPQVTGPANAKQTVDYVRMIAHWRSLMP